jgi:hypothetical protein
MKKFTDYIAEKDPVQSEVLGKMWNAAKKAVGMGSPSTETLEMPKNNEEVRQRINSVVDRLDDLGQEFFRKGERAAAKALTAAGELFKKQYPVELQSWKTLIDKQMGRVPWNPQQQPAGSPPQQNLMQQGR